MGDTILGPIDYLAVEWPQRHVTGEGFRLLMDLVDREIVRVLDLMFIAKDAGGRAPDMAEKLAQLKQLGDLRAAGVLTDAEFEIQKANILSA